MRGSAEEHLRTQGGQTPFYSNRKGMSQDRVNGAAGVDHDHLVGNAGSKFGQCEVIAQSAGITAGDCAYEPIECPEGVGATGAIGCDAHTLLEFAKRLIGLPAESPVHTSRRKPQFVEPTLQLGYVVADDQVSGPIGQNSITELPSSLIKSRECLGADDSVDGDSALLLESAYGKVEVVGENLSDRRDVPAQVGQPGTHFRDGRTGVAVTQDHGEGALPYR